MRVIEQRTFVPRVPTRLTWWEGAGESYEVWVTPEVKPGYAVKYFRGDRELATHRYGTEVAARTNFERLVEEHTV
jgi:hypothetical protein